MPRRALQHAGGLVLHVLNRAARRAQLFFDEQDYRAFEEILRRACQRTPTRLLAYCVMPNHWHLVLWVLGNEVPALMHWLTLTHAKRWHENHGTTGTGHVYQNRYRAIPVQTGAHLMVLLRYVERNPLRAGLVQRAEDWRWGSLWRRCNSCDDLLLSEWPLPQPADWLDHVNAPQSQAEFERIQRAITHGRPLGDTDWAGVAASRIHMRLRPPGRPAKPNRV